MSAVLGFAMLLSCAASDEVPASDWPLAGPLAARIYCIEGFESQHGLYMFNRSSGASGYLQWLPSTARRWGVVVGDRYSEWAAAAQIAQLGEKFFRSQWVPLQRGLC